MRRSWFVVEVLLVILFTVVRHSFAHSNSVQQRRHHIHARSHEDGNVAAAQDDFLGERSVDEDDGNYTLLSAAGQQTITDTLLSKRATTSGFYAGQCDLSRRKRAFLLFKTSSIF
jgi:hypothetical protein